MTTLNLQRPLAVFDLETTGTNVSSDRIVEISILKIHPDGTRQTLTMRLNPTIPIPAGASEVHKIYDADVANCPTFKDKAIELHTFLMDCDLAGYNSNKFDIPLLVEEFMRHGIDFNIQNKKLVDVQNIFHKLEQRTLSAAYRFYCNRELENAHSAEADVTATFEILEAQLQRYQNELKNDISFLHEFSSRSNNVDLAGWIVRNKEGVEVFSFGKHKGKPVMEVFTNEPSYFNWIINGEFPQYTKKVITEIKSKIPAKK